MSKPIPELLKKHDKFINWDTWSLKKNAPADLVKAWDDFNIDEEDPDIEEVSSVDKSKMTAAERVFYEELEKKYGK